MAIETLLQLMLQSCKVSLKAAVVIDAVVLEPSNDFKKKKRKWDKFADLSITHVRHVLVTSSNWSDTYIIQAEHVSLDYYWDEVQAAIPENLFACNVASVLVSLSRSICQYSPNCCAVFCPQLTFELPVAVQRPPPSAVYHLVDVLEEPLLEYRRVGE